MNELFTQTLYQDGVTLTDPMSEFTGIPFRANARLDGMVSVDRAATIPDSRGDGETKEAPRGRDRTPRKSRFEPIDAFQRRQRSEAADKRAGTKEETERKESKTEPKKERKKFTPDFETSQKRTRTRSLTSTQAERRREKLIKLKKRRQGGATTLPETPSDSFERTPPRYTNEPVRMRSLTPTRPSGSGQGLRAQSTPPSQRQ